MDLLDLKYRVLTVIYNITDRISSSMDLGAFIVLSLFTIGIFVFTILSYRDSIKSTKKKYEECTMGVWAEVLGVRKKTETKRRRVKTKNGYRTKTYTVTYFIPTLKFDFNFETVEKECDTHNQNRDKYVVGEQVKIFLDPKNIDNIRYTDEPLEDILKSNRKRYLVVFTILCFFFGFIWAGMLGFI